MVREDDPTQLPTIEELDVHPAPVASPRSRWSPLAIGVMAALIGWGYLGREDSPAPPVVPETRPQPSESLVAGSTVVLESPAEAAQVPGTGVVVEGTASGLNGPVLVSVSVGELTLGQGTVPLSGGRFAGTIATIRHRNAPPIPVSVRVSAANQPNVVLAEHHIRLTSVAAVTVDRAVWRQDADGSAFVNVEGSAAIALGSPRHRRHGRPDRLGVSRQGRFASSSRGA